MARGRLVAVAAIIILLFAAVPVGQQALWSSTVDSQTHVGFNDTITVNEGTVHTLASSNKDVVYAPSEDINVSQSGSTFISEGNWTWHRVNGTIKINANSALTNGSEAHVAGYYARSSTAQNTTERFLLLPTRDIGAEWLMAAVVALMLLALGLLARTP